MCLIMQHIKFPYPIGNEGIRLVFEKKVHRLAESMPSSFMQGCITVLQKKENCLMKTRRRLLASIRCTGHQLAAIQYTIKLQCIVINLCITNLYGHEAHNPPAHPKSHRSQPRLYLVRFAHLLITLKFLPDIKLGLRAPNKQ